MNILHLINDLRVGGTEKSLINYCVNDKKNKNIILSFGISDNFTNLLKKNNIKLIKLNILVSDSRCRGNTVASPMIRWTIFALQKKSTACKARKQ